MQASDNLLHDLRLIWLHFVCIMMRKIFILYSRINGQESLPIHLRCFIGINAVPLITPEILERRILQGFTAHVSFQLKQMTYVFVFSEEKTSVALTRANHVMKMTYVCGVQCGEDLRCLTTC